MSTLRAFTAGVAGINLDQRYARKDRLVFQEGSQLCECPRVKNRSLRFPSPYPRPYPCKFLDGDTAIRAFGFLDDLFRNRMVDVGGKASFLAGEFLQVALGRLALRCLKVGTEFAMPITDVVDHRAGERISIRIGGNLNYAKIDSEKVVNNNLFGIGNIARCSQKPLAAMVDQVRFTILVLEHLFLAWSSRIWNWFSAVKSPDAYPVIAVAEDAGIVTDGSMLGKPALDFLIKFVGIADLGKKTNNNLRRKWKSQSRFMVDRFVERERSVYFPFPCLMAHPIAALVGCFQSTQEQLRLLRIGIQPDFNN